MIKCILIEDEINAQQVLLHYISKIPFLTCLGHYESCLEVSKDLLEEVDVIFLDIELPEINGLEFLKKLEHAPSVIVTTAYPNFAVDAFEQAVVDYLVKPFSYERFVLAVDRVKAITATNKETYLFVYADKTNHKLKTKDILYLKSELDYISIVTEKERILLLGSLTIWEKKMAKFSFVRVHRSYIVNKGFPIKI